MPAKKCSKCGIIKSHSDFNRNKNNKDGLQNQCRECSHNDWRIYALKREKRSFVCKGCGKPFLRVGRRYDYCPLCRIKTCPNCGITFTPSSGNHKQVCCSRECAALYDTERIQRIISKRGTKPKTQKSHKCIVCGREFYYSAYRDPKYCSKACWGVRGEWIFIQCAYCGKEKRVLACIVKNVRNKYCSKKCYDLHKRELYKGEKSHLWKGGKTKLSFIERTRATYRVWRESVFQRDHYTCQKCGSRSRKDREVYLHAHHIKHFSSHPELRFVVDNGITLCSKCHELYHLHKFVHAK